MVRLIFDIPSITSVINLEENRVFTKNELTKVAKEHIRRHFPVEVDFYLTSNGKIYDDHVGSEAENIHVIPRLPGGKGGFGSMLRAIGAQIEKTTNREACRDLSGRRLRDINEEKRLKKWIAEQAEREQEALKRKRKKLEKLNEIVKHDFVDEDYTKARLEMPEKIHESVEEGLKASVEEPSCSKSVPENKPKVAKKKIKGHLWVEDDLDGLEDSESNSEGEEVPKKKLKSF